MVQGFYKIVDSNKKPLTNVKFELLPDVETTEKTLTVGSEKEDNNKMATVGLFTGIMLLGTLPFAIKLLKK